MYWYLFLRVQARPIFDLAIDSKKLIFLVHYGHFRPEGCPVDDFFAPKIHDQLLLHSNGARTMPVQKRYSNRILIRKENKWGEGYLCSQLPRAGKLLHAFSVNPSQRTAEVLSAFTFWHKICRMIS